MDKSNTPPRDPTPKAVKRDKPSLTFEMGGPMGSAIRQSAAHDRVAHDHAEHGSHAPAATRPIAKSADVSRPEGAPRGILKKQFERPPEKAAAEKPATNAKKPAEFSKAASHGLEKLRTATQDHLKHKERAEQFKIAKQERSLVKSADRAMTRKFSLTAEFNSKSGRDGR